MLLWWVQKMSYQTTIEELECPHCKKTLEVGFDYNVVIDSPDSIYIEVENAGVVKN
jgi:hypothetical protein